MANKGDVVLSFCADAQFGTAIEFIALATRATVNGTSIAAPAATYTFAEASRARKHGIYHADGYRGLDESRWRISKLLGAVPQQHKARVFSWAAEAINSVDEFHNARGGVPLPEIFECRYDHARLVADRELRFELR